MGRPRKHAVTFNDETGEVMEHEEQLPHAPPQVYMTTDDEDIRQAPIQNDEFLPLFPDADKFPESTVAHIKVTKLSPVGEDGYKGELPATSTEEVIWRSWKDGTYRIEACNAQGKVLRRRDNLVISKGPQPGEASAPAPAQAGADMTIVNRVLDTVKEQISSMKQDKEIAVSQVRRQQEDLTKFMSLQSDKSTTLLAEHYKSGGASQQSFFAAMMQMQAQAHQAMIQQMMMMQQLSSQQNDPRVLMTTLMQGIQLARELGDGHDDDEPASVQMMKVGAGMIGDIKDMAVSSFLKPKKLAPPPIVIPVNPLSVPPPTGIPEAPALAQTSPDLRQTSQTGNGHANPEKPKKERTFTPEEAFKMRELKRIADEKGLDFPDLLDQALGFVGGAPDADAPEDAQQQVADGDTAQAEGQPSNGTHGAESTDTQGAA